MKFSHIPQFTLCVIIGLFAIFATGCSEPKIEYIEKKVPVKCEVKKNTLPAYTDDPLIDVPNILIYTEILEGDLKFCTTGTIN